MAMAVATESDDTLRKKNSSRIDKGSAIIRLQRDIVSIEQITRQCNNKSRWYKLLIESQSLNPLMTQSQQLYHSFNRPSAYLNEFCSFCFSSKVSLTRALFCSSVYQFFCRESGKLLTKQPPIFRAINSVAALFAGYAEYR